VNEIEHSFNVVVMAYFVKFVYLGAQRLTEMYTLVLFPATEQCLVLALLHISATYCSHHQQSYNTIMAEAACHMSADGNHI